MNRFVELLNLTLRSCNETISMVMWFWFGMMVSGSFFIPMLLSYESGFKSPQIEGGHLLISMHLSAANTFFSITFICIILVLFTFAATFTFYCYIYDKRSWVIPNLVIGSWKKYMAWSTENWKREKECREENRQELEKVMECIREGKHKEQENQ